MKVAGTRVLTAGMAFAMTVSCVVVDSLRNERMAQSFFERNLQSVAAAHADAQPRYKK